ncbi:transporter substrate-binding domain-containing protein [Ammoniphilus sp. YIM 78166]|uniref:ABC transporter substrate-binding protein n=1 Tax=Ammoniphilus sp. YIM 78166 TaxID=1644106 RepID=UPI00107019C4|nr:transporter substrate-binding domain-containing protein [Ammoniphilus sp. YIM 78166]
MARPHRPKLYKVGTEAANPPYTFINRKGALTGFDIELFNCVARKAGLNVRYVPMAWTSLLGSLRSRRTDILVSSITITLERAALVDFSKPYFRTTTALLVPKHSSIRSINDLRGKRVGVQVATITLDQLEKFLGKNNPGIVTFRDNPATFRALRNGSVDAVAADLHVLRYVLRTSRTAAFKIVRDSRFAIDLHGFAVRNGHCSLLKKINVGLKRTIASGEWTRIYRKYFRR